MKLNLSITCRFRALLAKIVSICSVRTDDPEKDGNCIPKIDAGLWDSPEVGGRKMIWARYSFLTIKKAYTTATRKTMMKLNKRTFLLFQKNRKYCSKVFPIYVAEKRFLCDLSFKKFLTTPAHSRVERPATKTCHK